MGSMWGPQLRHARNMYIAIIRAAAGYGAPIWHKADPAGRGGITPTFERLQNKCLRAVLGAYKATPRDYLGVEAYIPPVDL